MGMQCTAGGKTGWGGRGERSGEAVLLHSTPSEVLPPKFNILRKTSPLCAKEAKKSPKRFELQWEKMENSEH